MPVKWVAVFCVCLLLSIGIPIGYATWYTAMYARHACQALDVLTRHPAPRPASPAANPLRQQAWEFYQGLMYWEREDGC